MNHNRGWNGDYNGRRQTKHPCHLCGKLSTRGRFVPINVRDSKKKKLWVWVCAGCLGWGI